MIEAEHLLAPPIVDIAADDLAFIQLVRHVVSAELEGKAAHGLFLIRIDNWFDHKWRNFSGTGRVAFGHFTALEAYDPDTALDAIYRDSAKSTFPPFTPNRIVAQDFYRKDENGVYVLDGNGPRVHSASRERSSANLHRRITTHNNSCLFVWFSSNALTNRRGSLMIYRANGTIVTSWYASFSLNGKWRVVQTQGISRQLLLRWLERSPAPARDTSS
jgi:hypothetical protein